MDLRTVLTTDTVDLHLKGTTKEAIIDEMLDLLVKAGKVTDKAAARECVLDRERKMSTGMKHGIAIPHGKTDTVSDLVACIGISDNPVDFDSLDQEPRKKATHSRNAGQSGSYQDTHRIAFLYFLQNGQRRSLCIA